MERAAEAAEPVPPETGERAATIYKTAIDKKSAPFDYLVDIHRGMQRGDKENKKFHSQYYADILNAFETEWGKIHYLAVYESYALVITQKSHIFHKEKTPDLVSLKFIHRCDKLETEAHRLLVESKIPGSDLFSCMDMLAELLSHLYYSLEEVNKGKIKLEDHIKLVSSLTEELAILEKTFVLHAKRCARHLYYHGMRYGLVFVLVVTVLFCGALWILKVPTNIIASFFGSLISGGIGAIISVLTRMSSEEKFPLDHEAGPSQNRRLGNWRPVIGATMGLMLYFLMMCDLLPLDVPVNSSTQLFFILSIAFSAGFTERWAQDMIPGTKEEKTPEPKKKTTEEKCTKT